MNVAVCEGLGEIFKQEWDKQYGTTKGVWDDTTKSGNELYNMESPRRHAKPYLTSYQSGKRSEWDCSALFDAILYSNAIKRHLNPHMTNKVDELRKLRNELIHTLGPQHKISDVEFEKAYKRVQKCFKALKLSTASVEKITNSFKRKFVTSLQNLACICFIVFIAGLLSCVLYYWLSNPVTVKSLFRFRVLPARPVHLVANRSRTVNAILQELQKLSIKNNRSLTYLYISGNPGSGKSQLARLVGQRYGTNFSSNWSNDTAFVMTLKGTSLPDILESYVDFARRVDCNTNNIANIINSRETSTMMKIHRLQTEIAKRLKNFKNNWLLIVDNVVKMSEIVSFLPQLEDEDWQAGQVLITTQDMSSIPSNSSFTVHISVSQGMNSIESCEFLADLSGLAENQDFVSEVAEILDYQPLALASAAFYVKQLRESKASPQFTWKDYLKKFDEGKRNLTEMKLSKVNQAYSLTMSTAVLLSVKTLAENDPILKHAFTLLSFLSHKPLPLDIIARFVTGIEKYSDEQNVRLQILQCSLILSSENQKSVLISLHRVVHDSIQLYISNDIEVNTRPRVPLYVLQLLLEHKHVLDNGAVLIPHLEAFYVKTKDLSSDVFIPHSMGMKQKMQEQFVNLTASLMEYGEFLLSRYYLVLAFEIVTNEPNQNRTDSFYTSFPNIDQIFLNLGVAEANLRNTTKAKEYFKRGLKICLQQYGHANTRVANFYIHLAILACLRPNECHESVTYAERALKLDNRSDIRGVYYMNRGTLKHFEGNLQEAAKYYLKASEIFRDRTPVRDNIYPVFIVTNRAFIFASLGILHFQIEMYEDSKDFFRNAIEFYQMANGLNHLGLADSFYNLGLLHSYLREFADAEKYFRRALEIYSKQMEPSHKNIAIVSQHLAGVLQNTKRLSEAEQLSKKYGTCPRPQGLHSFHMETYL